LKKTLITAGIVLVVALLIVLNLIHKGEARMDVEVEKVTRRDVSQVITASGNIQPRRRVNVSASALGKVTRVAVEEGDMVKKGDFLLQIDAAPYQSAVEQLTAAVRGAEADLEVQRASERKASADLERERSLQNKGFSSDQALRDAQVAADMAHARVKAARETLTQQRANLRKANHDLREVRITAAMSGMVTALNVEEGESAIMGTINNPGTVLLTIADMTEMQAEVRVDETEVVHVHPGQKARVRLDAYPDTTFAGTVREVGSSAMRSQVGLGQESVDFKVVVTILDSIPGIRPGLSASVDITVATADSALTVPIQALTVRSRAELKRWQRRAHPGRKSGTVAAGVSADTAKTTTAAGEEKKRDIEGVFVVADKRASFRRVRVGIPGERVFEILDGLKENEKVVTGPLRAINDLKSGEAVRIRNPHRRKKG